MLINRSISCAISLLGGLTMNAKQEVCEERYSSKEVTKFIIYAAIGIFMFFFPVKDGDVSTIPIEYVVSHLVSKSKSLGQIYALAVIILASVLPFYRKTWNRDATSTAFTISKIIGAIVAVLVFFNYGPEAVLRDDHGPFLFNALAVGVGALIPVGAIFLTFLMNYGFIDFFGLLMRPIMKTVWLTPGRSAVDAVASFMGSTAMGIMITNGMYTNKKYNTKEASIIVTGFSTVCITFVVVVAKTLNIMHLWTPFFITAFVTTFIVTAIVARLKPLKSMPGTYYNNEEGFPEEPVNGNLILCSFKEGVKVCSEAGSLFKNVTENVKNAFNLVFEVLPNFMSIGLFGLLLADYTPVFDILGYIFYPLTMLLQIPEPLLAAKAAFLGLPEMYLPVLVVVKAPELTKFIVGVLSVTQVIMLSTTVPCILATKIPVSLKDMVIIWFERTVISLIIITPISYMIFKFI